MVYLRTTYEFGPPSLSLIAAKTKVSPLKQQSIPRLELCGAHLLSKLLTSVRMALSLDLYSVFVWSDSTIVLHWLDGSPRRFKTFVGNSETVNVHSQHRLLLHAGPTLLMSTVGTSLYIVGARRLVRTICRRCVICRKDAAVTKKQMMGQLSSQRVIPSPPFSRVGIDYAGPLTIKKGHTRKPVYLKAYICIFVCFVTKATDLEVVSDLTSEAFLACLQQFTS